MGIPAMQAIASITLSAASSSITFASIPATYRDLHFVNFQSSSSGNQDVGFRINGTTGTSVVYMAGFGSSAGSGTASDILGYVSSAGQLNQIDIFDYAVTDKHKSGVIRYGDSGNFAAASAFRWASTDAITSVQFYLGSGTFAAGSTFTLYGVLA